MTETDNGGASWEVEALPQRTPRERKRLKPAPPPEPEHGPSASEDEEEPEDDESTHVKLNDIVYKFKYEDHPADIILHSWGDDLDEALSNVALCMYNYMTPLSGIEPGVDAIPFEVEASGDDLSAMIYNFLDALLFKFHTESLVCTSMAVEDFDRDDLRIKVKGSGEPFDASRHERGTEIKAITHSLIEVREQSGETHVRVLVDI